MGYATTRSLERVAAAMGELESAPIAFEAAADIPEGGVLLALPALLATPYGPKTRSAESQVQPRVTSPSETSGFASRRVSRKLHGSNGRRQNRGHGAYLRRASRS